MWFQNWYCVRDAEVAGSNPVIPTPYLTTTYVQSEFAENSAIPTILAAGRSSGPFKAWFSGPVQEWFILARKKSTKPCPTRSHPKTQLTITPATRQEIRKLFPTHFLVHQVIVPTVQYLFWTPEPGGRLARYQQNDRRFYRACPPVGQSRRTWGARCIRLPPIDRGPLHSREY